MDGKQLQTQYKDHLSDFNNWNQKEHAEDFILYPKNIGYHLCIDESRKMKECSLENEGEIRDECDGLRRIEDKSEVGYLLNVLSPEQREAVILRIGEELSFWEIAKVMGCNMRTAQSRVRNALKIMRKEQENER